MSVSQGSEMPWLLPPAHLYSASLCAPISSLGSIAPITPLQYQLGLAYHPGAAAPHPHHHPAAAAASSAMAGLQAGLQAGLFPHHLHHLQSMPYSAALALAPGAAMGSGSAAGSGAAASGAGPASLAAPPPGSPEPPPFRMRSAGNVTPTS